MPAILVMDDEPSLLATLALILEAKGYEVETALSVERARELIETRRFAALLADLNMPGDGATAIAVMRQRQPETPIVLITGYVGPQDVPAEVRTMVNAILFKPIEIPSLLRQLAAWTQSA
ncbi:MAG: response regulator [Terriglobales bacterium]